MLKPGTSRHAPRVKPRPPGNKRCIGRQKAMEHRMHSYFALVAEDVYREDAKCLDNHPAAKGAANHDRHKLVPVTASLARTKTIVRRFPKETTTGPRHEEGSK